MGDFSRDPKERLADSIAKHYVGVRMQQGVPLLDADWNTMDDLRRFQHENLNASVIGNGTPVGSIGFRIIPIAGGAVSTIIIASTKIDPGLSTIRIDLSSSNAASALGFDENNYFAIRDSSSPAILTSNKTQPFLLDDGSTLILQADDYPSVTITFNSADFADITNASAAEVVSVITAATSLVNVGEGEGNDFLITGGNDDFRSGQLLANGIMIVNEQDMKFSEQQLFDNLNLAERWGVSPVLPLETSPGNDAFVVYVDIWNREVDITEDENLLDDRIGIETSLRLRREWVVRTEREHDYAAAFQSRPAGHVYYVLSLLQRNGGESAIRAGDLFDQRETDVALRREIAFLSTSGISLVDTKDFLEMLTVTRDNIHDFIVFLSTKFFTPPEVAILGPEIAGFNSLNVIANIADQGIALLSVKAMSTRDALLFLEQILEAEQRFVTIWNEVMLPLEKPLGYHRYQQSFTGMIERINAYLEGPAPSGFTTIPDSLSQGDLHQAVRAQNRINMEMGREIDRPSGFLLVTYFGSTTPTIIRNQTFDLRYELSGSVTPAGDIEIDTFIDPQWQVELRNSDGSIPFELNMGPGEDDAQFIVSVTAPDVAAAETSISLHIYSQDNEAGLWRDSTQKSLIIGQPTPPSEEAFAISLISSNISLLGGNYQFPSSVSAASFNFRFINNSNSEINVDIAVEPATAPAGWQIFAPSPSGLTDIDISARNNVEIGFDFIRPAASGSSLNFELRVTQQGTTNLLSSTGITIIAVAS